ncbi:very short patch repair endonuclease [uncultured Desulfovibrio sp.]|uniref:very short patch repair endonuclease n=1 Tax=uncultured Desulfovibrio sp. TaxID=167968 RepID=UPI002605F0F7|nr:DNA mismatch endonuclease Vsr [uncultured Desulfovibrio sp.]
MDSVSKEKRSWIMGRVKGRNTRPEKLVRSLLHGMGYRFRLQRADLPGRPDIVLPKYRTVIFVHGCYWHRHDCPNGKRLPKTRLDFWIPKLEGNRLRDVKNQEKLVQMGWKVLVLWECTLKDKVALQEKIRCFLNDMEK